MITYSCTHNGINEELIRQNFPQMHKNNGAWDVDPADEVVIQSIIDNFDHVAYAKPLTRRRIVKEASRRSAAIYPFIDPESEQAIGLYEFATDLYLSTISAARAPLSGRLLQFKNIHDKAVAAIAVINSSTDWQSILDYDVVNGPGW